MKRTPNWELKALEADTVMILAWGWMVVILCVVEEVTARKRSLWWKDAHVRFIGVVK